MSAGLKSMNSPIRAQLVTVAPDGAVTVALMVKVTVWPGRNHAALEQEALPLGRPQDHPAAGIATGGLVKVSPGGLLSRRDIRRRG